jgi:hypothetical protein
MVSKLKWVLGDFGSKKERKAHHVLLQSKMKMRTSCCSTEEPMRFICNIISPELSLNKGGWRSIFLIDAKAGQHTPTF